MRHARARASFKIQISTKNNERIIIITPIQGPGDALHQPNASTPTSYAECGGGEDDSSVQESR